MGYPEWIALYGALLASVLAIVQIVQWRSSRDKLRVKWTAVYEYGPGCDLDATITNVINHAIFVEDVFMGNSFRPWLMPWRRKSYTGISLPIKEHYRSLEYSSGLIFSGGIVEVSGTREELDKHVEKISIFKGFSRQEGLWIVHSGSEQEFHWLLP